MVMKCIICDREFEPTEELETMFNAICDDCAETRAELTNGKGEE